MMSNLNERRAEFVYNGARLAAIAAKAPIIPVQWSEREESFKTQFLDVIEPFRQDKQRPRSVRSTYDNFAGLSSRPEEFLSDVYADLIHGGKARYESQKYRVVYSYVAKLAKQYGLPYQPLYRIKGGKWVRI